MKSAQYSLFQKIKRPAVQDTHTHVHTHLHTRTHTYTYKHVHTHTYTHSGTAARLCHTLPKILICFEKTRSADFLILLVLKNLVNQINSLH